MSSGGGNFRWERGRIIVMAIVPLEKPARLISRPPRSPPRRARAFPRRAVHIRARRRGRAKLARQMVDDATPPTRASHHLYSTPNPTPSRRPFGEPRRIVVAKRARSARPLRRVDARDANRKTRPPVTKCKAAQVYERGAPALFRGGFRRSFPRLVVGFFVGIIISRKAST